MVSVPRDRSVGIAMVGSPKSSSTNAKAGSQVISCRGFRCRRCSIALQHGVPLNVIRNASARFLAASRRARSAARSTSSPSWSDGMTDDFASICRSSLARCSASQIRGTQRSERRYGTNGSLSNPISTRARFYDHDNGAMR